MSRNGDEQRNQVFTDAENYIKQASDMLQREAVRLRQEQQTIDAMSKKLEHVHFSYYTTKCWRSSLYNKSSNAYQGSKFDAGCNVFREV